ncbi:hypothetical protein H7171_01875 [Candidatus Saccharibacteria bacterium]|nr:hypothetical protein [Candidatus Saccharibacteria bacterium]
MSHSFFREADGHIVLAQWPNIPLSGWLVFKILSRIIANGQLKTGFEQLSMAFLFAWAVLKILQGVNHFRRILGLVILLMISVSFFK